MISAPIKAVIFDLDGTLVDTADDFVPVVQQLRAENGLGPMEPLRIRRSVSNGARALVSLGLSLDAEDPSFEEMRLRLLTLYGEVLGRHARPYPGVRELLSELENRGISWGIATNKPSAYTGPLLESLDLMPPPGAVLCPDDVRERKPHPESLLRICEALGCEPAATVYVGDHARDIEAGRRAGAITVAAAYGYIEEGDSADSWGADHLVSDSLDLAPLLLAPTEERAHG